MFTTGKTVGLTEWIIDDPSLVYIYLRSFWSHMHEIVIIKAHM